MNSLVLRPIETVEPTALLALQSEVIDDDERSALLSEVVATEAAARSPGIARDPPAPFGLAAYHADVLVGWTQGYRQGKSEFHMLNSGVAGTARRTGVYSALVEGVLDHARAQGYARVTSCHAASNAAVLIAKLRLGFQLSGFEYLEVYGPLAQLTFIVGEERRRLYNARSAALRAASH
jgi:GNAT superfamily N-acetyltransferase